MASYIQWLERLISFDTTSTCSNLPLIDAVANYLSEEKVEFFKVFNKERTKAHLFASFPDKYGRYQKDGLMFSGHSDTVPVEGQAWQSNPFNLLIKKDKVDGRGSADMKGFLACLLSCVPDMKVTKLKRPLHIAISYDEELSCRGVSSLIAALEKEEIHPAWAWVGEPTSMQVMVSHKGHATFVCEISGKGAHSSMPDKGVNAIFYASKLVAYLEELSQRLKNNQDPTFDVPFTTLNVAKIHGGSAVNIVPPTCSLLLDCRNLPGLSFDRVEKEIRSFLDNQLLKEMYDKSEDPAIGISFYRTDEVLPLPNQEETAFKQWLSTEIGLQGGGKVGYATEGGYFAAYGSEVAICGPGSIAMAHQANEYVPLSQLEACEQALKRAILRLSV